MNPNETWQVDVNGQIYETSLQELTQWINEGSLLRGDKVRRGNLRWLEAGKIPVLFGFFNAKDLGQPIPQIQFSAPPTEFNTESTPFPQQAENFAATQNFPQNQTGYTPPNNFTINESLPPTENFNNNYPPPPPFSPQTEPNDFQHQFGAQQQMSNEYVCAIHENAEAHYVCDTCTSVFCKACPSGYGGSVKICPMCGAMCIPIRRVQENEIQNFQFENDMREGFGIADFGRALVYPFKFKASLFFGAFLFMLFSLGQSALGAGSFMMGSAVIICFMLANMLTFAVLANTVENFAHAKVGGNFMPSFDEFSLWDDVVHPFFLYVGVYIVSFGLMIALILIAISVMWSSVTSAIKKESDAATEIVKKEKQAKTKASPTPQTIWNDNDRAYQEDVERTTKELQLGRLKSLGIGDPDANLSGNQIGAIIMRNVGIFAIPIILSFLWGFFYYPIACAVAGYTRSFMATINPTVGLDTIKRLGLDYWKVLGMTLLLSIVSGIIGAILHLIFLPFDLPGMGNLPAIAIGSWFTFYFSVVFAVMLGYALYKNTRKLNLFQN